MSLPHEAEARSSAQGGTGGSVVVSGVGIAVAFFSAVACFLSWKAYEKSEASANAIARLEGQITAITALARREGRSAAESAIREHFSIRDAERQEDADASAADVVSDGSTSRIFQVSPLERAAENGLRQPGVQISRRGLNQRNYFFSFPAGLSESADRLNSDSSLSGYLRFGQTDNPPLRGERLPRLLDFSVERVSRQNANYLRIQYTLAYEESGTSVRRRLVTPILEVYRVDEDLGLQRFLCSNLPLEYQSGLSSYATEWCPEARTPPTF